MYGSRGGWVRAGMAAVGAVAVLLMAACTSSDGDGGGTGGPGGDPDHRPRAADRFWVDPDGNAARRAAGHRRAGEPRAAALVHRIASRPTGVWIGTGDPEGEARRVTAAAAAADRTPLLVLYDIPHRDCGQHSAGGAPDGAAYRAWVEAVARGVGAHRAAVVLEPDAVMHMVDGCTGPRYHEERYALLAGAVRRLARLPHTRVYLDAGNPGWSRPEALPGPLLRAGLADADGFAVNVANFHTTAASRAYGRRISALTGGKHFVIDTGRNGNGPHPAGEWCNPPGRALGEPPTTRTGDPLVDAHLWVKRPGESDGPCRGGPRAGEWFAPYALELARNGH
ncbi:glycoside hydrolase family 6 protein [Streptomyces sp. DH12]|uniref:glycoside hydrolase family 6 protein n=1 Tax=Streptomyces sp. DH12 TaxID=2857010 RepID=UPI001E35A96E|nr:glycoside hydrolase family 6 protein [Streptomyces sp. DH12]